MKKLIRAAVVAIVLLAILVMLGPFYIIREGEQAVVTRFGQIVDTQTTAGLKFKMPVIDNVVKYSARLMSWDDEARRMPTAENQFIWVDATARWRISDPAQFYQTVTTMERAFSRLDDLIESAIRTVISNNRLSEAVRDSNLINQMSHAGVVPAEEVLDEEDERIDEILSLVAVNVQQTPVSKGRQRLSEEMHDRTEATAAELGIEIRDIVIRQIRYSDDLTESVHNRMVSERRQIAEAYRSYGEGRKQELIGQMENEKRGVLSAAYARAERIRGEADAIAARIYSDAYRQDPAFFEFWRAVESYRRVLPQFSKTLSTDMDYFNFLYSETGR